MKLAGKKISVKGIWKTIKTGFAGFQEHKIPKLSGSLAYYTVFSMGPLLIIVIGICSLFFGTQAIEGKIFSQLDGFLGHDTALQLQQIIKNASISGKGKFATIIGAITLLIGATSVFAEIQDSINTIWDLKSKPRKGWISYLKNRFLSFSIIASLGFLLLVSLAISAVLEGLGGYLQSHFPGISIVFLYIINQAFSLLITSTIFAVIFKVLPDARIRWKDIIAGAIVTATLFTLGRAGISFYISKTHTGSVFGAAGSLVIILVWVYYSSIILYLGAEFTKVFAVSSGAPITPSPYAVTIRQVEATPGER